MPGIIDHIKDKLVEIIWFHIGVSTKENMSMGYMCFANKTSNLINIIRYDNGLIMSYFDS